MARDLSDVVDYFLPRAEDPTAAAPRRTWKPDAIAPRSDRPAALPIVSLPIGERDVLRAAFAWNLTVEVARLGASATLLAPRDQESATLWPEAGTGPLGAEVVLTGAEDLAELNRAALDLAVTRAADSNDGGVVFVRVPPDWLVPVQEARALLRWVLLFTSADGRDLLETYALAKRLHLAASEAQVGVTVHGVRGIREAERAFGHLASVAARHLGRSLASYGLLVDDLDVYRAIVARRPIGLEHPQSRAARALGDVARLVLEDARKVAVA